MFRYADPTACPRCRAALPASPAACPVCHAALDDTRAYDVFLALQQVDVLVGRLADRATARATPPLPVVPTAPAPVGPTPPAVPVPTPAPALPVPPPTPPTPPMGAATTAPPPRRPAMSGLTVPKVLLGLGALCLVVAALVFLAVAWASLGVGGRTMVLLGFTLVAGSLAAWSAIRGLRAGAEALSTVALGLLLLDLTGARTAGWFGSLGVPGFIVLASGVLLTAGALATVAARRTREPRLVAPEVIASLAAMTAAGDLGAFEELSAAGWGLTVTVMVGALTAAAFHARLTVLATTCATISALGWLVLASAGVAHVLDHPSWSATLGDIHGWPLPAAIALATAPAVVRRIDLRLRVASASVAAALATMLVAAPSFDESAEVVIGSLIAVIVAHAAANHLLPGLWRWLTVVPLALAGTVVGASCALAGLVAAAALADHGGWDAPATVALRADQDLGAAWAVLLPAGTVAAIAALVSIAGIGGPSVAGRLLSCTPWVVVGSVSLAPLFLGVPAIVEVALLVVATGACGVLAVRVQPANWLGVPPCAVLALAGALLNPWLTIGVLALATAALAWLEGRREAWLRTTAAWLLPPLAGATAWAIATHAGVSLDWRAVPVLCVAALIALARPSIAHELSSLGVALLALALAGASTPDPRLVAAQFLAIALVATVTGLRSRPTASLVGLGFHAVAALCAWQHPATAAAVLALATATAVLHERRAVEPIRSAGRLTTPLALGALLWSLSDLAGLDAGWIGLPTVLALAVLAVWRPEPARELSAATGGLVAALASILPAPDPGQWTAAYLVLGGAALTTSALRHTARQWLAALDLAAYAVAALVVWGSPLQSAGAFAVCVAVALVHESRRNSPAAAISMAAGPVALGGLLWQLSEVAGLDGAWRGLPAAVVLVALAAWRADLVREVAAAVTAGLVGAAAITGLSDLEDVQTWTAVYLTLFGAGFTASSLLHPTRRHAAWAGLACFSVAQWLRLEQLGVTTVEAYTLPLAVVLLMVGVVALRRTTRSSFQTLAAGLSLALVPSLLQALVQPLGLRAALLGIACLACIAVGVNRRLAAPLVAGAATLAVLVLRQMTIAQYLPQWALIGVAGVALTVVGLTWEARLANVRAAAGYVRDLR